MAINNSNDVPDSEQESANPTIPLYPELSSTSPGSPDLASSEVFLIGAKLASSVLTGSPALVTFDVPDLVTMGRRLWRWHMVAYAIETEGMTAETLAGLLTLLK